MNVKKMLLSFLVVFVLLEVTNFIIHGVILAPLYNSPELQAVFRSRMEMETMMWLFYLIDIVWAFFFVFFFIKGYEGKGIAEGIRFGIYIGIFWHFCSNMGSYVVYPVPGSLVFRWIIFGLIQMIILGAAVAFIYKPRKAFAES